MTKIISQKLNFFEFLSTLFTKKKEFFSKYITEKRPPFFYLILWMYGATLMFDKMDAVQMEGITSWPKAWAVVVIFGLFSGVIAYWVAGSIYHLFVLIAGGKGKAFVSRRILLYAGIPVYLVTLVTQLANTFIYGGGYFEGVEVISWLAILSLILIFISIGYFIYFGYIGVKTLQKTKLFRTIIFFIILPITLYMFIFGVGFMMGWNDDELDSKNTQGLDLIRTQDYEKSEELFKSVIENTDDTDMQNKIIAYENLALAQEYKGENDKAKETYQKILVMVDENNPTYYVTLGKIDIIDGKVEDAIEKFNKALEIDSNNFDAHNQLGFLYLGEVSDEIMDLEKALVHNKKSYELNGDPESLQNLAMNYFALELYADSFQAFSYLDEIVSNHASAKFFLGFLYYMDGDLENAKEYLNAAIAIDPELISEEVEAILAE